MDMFAQQIHVYPLALTFSDFSCFWSLAGFAVVELAGAQIELYGVVACSFSGQKGISFGAG